MRLRFRYALIGVLLGLGAPVGALLWQGIFRYHGYWSSAALLEWSIARFYYLYMLLGSVPAFSLFGFSLGFHQEALRDLAITDGLTSLYNHRFIQENLNREVFRSKRYGSPLSCLMIDIDDFKKINDQFGHIAGDHVLKDTARLIKEAVRQTDLVGRYGGEEFLVIMPETGQEAAALLGERILRSIDSYVFGSAGMPLHLTVSVGLSTYPNLEAGVKTKTALLSAADQALYQAKRKGKNCLVVWRA